MQKLISSLSCQNLITSILSNYHIPKPIWTGLKSGSKSCIPPIYILRDKKIKKFKSPFLTIHLENMTMVLHMQKYIFFIPNNFLCVPRVLFAHQDWKQLHNKSNFINCFKNTWGKTTCLGIFFSRQNIVLVSIWHEPDGCPQKYLKIIIH